LYEVYTRKTPRSISPVMSFSKIGQITFNQGAARILQKATLENVLLLWDAEERKIALKSTSNKKDQRSYRIRFADKGNGASFSCKTFLDYIGLDYSERRGLSVDINPDHEMFIEVKVPDSFFKKKVQQPKIVGKTG